MFETIKERWYDFLFSKIGSYVFNELWKYFKFTILLCSKALSFEILSCWNTRSENYLTEAVFVCTVNKVSPFPGRQTSCNARKYNFYRINFLYDSRMTVYCYGWN